MFESLGITILSPIGAGVVLGLVLGIAFGALALASGFCLRRAVAGLPEDRAAALALWVVALAAAVIGTQLAVSAGLLDFAGHRFHAMASPLLAIALGGAMFGVGMVLTRGCASRLTVLAGTGNLRALLVVLVLSVVAMASMRGVLAPLRLWLSGATVPLSNWAALPGPGLIWALAVGMLAVMLARRAGIGPRQVVLGTALGLLVPLGWLGTGLLLQDDFDPIPLESLSFIAPAADTLFWGVAATGVPARFGTGLVGGVVLGSLALALFSGRFRWQGFEGAAQTGRYLTGGALMGFGGVLAGGCTVGAGLSGVATLGISALVALAAIIVGARVAQVVLRSVSRGSDAPDTTPLSPRAE